MGMLERYTGARRVVLSPEHVVGRLSSCGLRLDASYVSTAHALLRWTGQLWEIRDLGSRNGTFVNGRRLSAGHTALLARGADLMFGDREETWRVLDDSGPTAVAVPVDGGEPSFYSAGLLAVPSAADPLVTIFADGDGWCLERHDERAAIVPGSLFEAAGKTWRFECPTGAALTAIAEEHRTLDDVKLVFIVSPDEEHVRLMLHMKHGATVCLGERTCFYLAMVLARQRLCDCESGAAEHGWLHVDSILSMIPDYSSYSALNVEIHRLRRVIGESNVHDAVRIVERRRGQVRLGTDRVEFLSAV
jgi:hypothetical protein